jgi:hypothetical protein
VAGTRFGIVLGFLTGSAAASVLQGQAPEGDEALTKPQAGVKGVLNNLRARVREAIEAGQEASIEREEELRRDFEATVHRESRKPS